MITMSAGSRLLGPILVATLAALGPIGSSTRADDPAEATATGDVFHLDASPFRSAWTVDVVPYAWGPWVNGTTSVVGRSANVHANQIQALEHLEQVPVMLYTEVRRGPWGFYGDIISGSVGFDESAVRTRPSRTLSGALGLDASAFIGEFGAVYEIAEWESGGATTAIDVLGGLRAWNQQADLKLKLTETIDIHHLVIERGYAVAKSGTVGWVDPLVGARLRRTLREGEEIYLRGDVGGFHAGSQFTWNITAAYAFELCAGDLATFTGLIGYRLLDVDYSRGRGYSLYTFDVLMQGPLLGLAIAL